MSKYVGSVVLLVHVEASTVKEAEEKILAIIHSAPTFVEGAAELELDTTEKEE